MISVLVKREIKYKIRLTASERQPNLRATEDILIMYVDRIIASHVFISFCKAKKIKEVKSCTGASERTCQRDFATFILIDAIEFCTQRREVFSIEDVANC